ncbi:MAG: HAD family phosphatase [Betaproteobacteria bacterium]|nr:HAD family phosphatase [Betaproteobacteria bacterium]
MTAEKTPRKAAETRHRARNGVEALLFDVGGVLVEIDFARAFAAWAEASGTAAESIAARFRFGEDYAAHERGEISAAEYFDGLRRSLGIDLTDEQFLRGWNAIFLREVDGARSVLRAAARMHPLYAFSNTCEAHRKYWLPRYAELVRPFAKLFLSSQIGLRKPSPEAFAWVARQIGVAAGRIAFFDDSPENVAGARSAGLIAYRVQSPAQALDILQNELRA